MDCEVWRPIFDATNAIAEGEENARRIRRMLSWWRLPANVCVGGGDSLIRSVSKTRRRLYEAIATKTGARAIVDSSKLPSDPAVLGAVPGIERYVLHLVRDPRAVAFSWRRKKLHAGRPGGQDMPRFGWTYSGVSWIVRNALAETVKLRTPADRRMTLRYEDYISDPGSALRRILDWIGMDDAPLEFLDGRTAHLGVNHTVAGNPSRMRTGPIELKRDDEWMDRIDSRGWWTVTALCAPLLGRYGYPVRRP
jgi:hypothetical protein